jgi:uncharacterized protein
MALENLSPSNLSFYAPRFEVQINNKKLAADISKAIIDVTVEEKMDQGASFHFTINDEFDVKTQTFKWLDHPQKFFEVGNTVGIRMGYGSDLQDMVLGPITSLEPSFFSGELPTITVSGQDLSYDKLKRPTPEDPFIERSYSEIARKIASKASLRAVVDETGTFESFIRKDNNVTYCAFLESLGRKVGYTFAIDRRTLYFIKPKDDQQEIITLELGKDIISFRPRMSTTAVVTEVEVRGHNPLDPKSPIIGRAQAGSERNQEPERQTASQIVAGLIGTVKRVITGVLVYSVEHANAVAQSELNRGSDSFIEGEVETIGIPQIRPGVTVRLDKMGQRFSGKYYVKETSHSIGNNGYRLRFTVKRNAL